VTGDGTKAVHGGASRERDPGEHRSEPVGAPLYRTSTFRFPTIDALRAGAAGGAPFYTRYAHPNFERVERTYAALHGAEDAVLFGSGMAALAAVLQGFTQSGARVVAQRTCYGGTHALLCWFAERWDLQVTWVDAEDVAQVEAALPGAALFLGENPMNPLLRSIDVQALARLCQAEGVCFVLDATFDGPINLKPLRLGVDLVVESATKALGGHSDLLAGLVAGDRGRCAPLRQVRKVLGSISDPDTAWLLERGLKTLPTRAHRQNATALALAGRLEADPRVSAVHHPGLRSHPQHERIQRLAKAGGGTGGGGMIAFRCAAGADAAIAFCDRVRLIANAPSLGGVESLVSLPRFTSHAAFSPAERLEAGIADDLVRLSIGLEEEADLWADIDAALG
jgi:cystathionine beta-lyase/cystathionine gamma-synthase